MTGPVGADGPDDHAQQPPTAAFIKAWSRWVLVGGWRGRHASGPPTMTLIGVTQLGEGVNVPKETGVAHVTLTHTNEYTCI